MQKRVLLASILVGALMSVKAYAQSPPQIVARFVPNHSSVTLAQLSSGHSGSGWLDFYSRPHHALRLAVYLSTHHGSAVAKVYGVNASSSTKLGHNPYPSIVMTAKGGWWTRNGIPNYNLSVKTYGPVYSMWSAQSYLKQVSSGQLESTILLHANASGRPIWDYRNLVPKLPGHGVIRSSYAQTEALGPLKRIPSITSLWPYVAPPQSYTPTTTNLIDIGGAFLQSPGTLRPPIVVNWSTGNVQEFSEVVTVRGQSNSYDFYSLTPIKPGQVNYPDFESPWGLYNLSRQPSAYPNLLIRNEHYFANDPWSRGISRKLLTAPLFNKPSEVIRYSWSDHPGNQHFNYKVDVFGFHHYRSKVPIAGGKAWVIAPPYKTYPSWVLGHKWPSMTFVDTNGGGYATSEGIYNWTSRGIGTGYWMGWTLHPNLSQYRSIQKGYRGEYRVGPAIKPRLYLSTVDGRMHLVGAQGGLWNLGNGTQLVEQNLTGGSYIDRWSRILAPATKHSKAHTVSSVTYLGGYLIYGGTHGIVIRRVGMPSSAYSIAPPSSHSTWANFVAKMGQRYPAQSPWNLYGWVQRYNGDSIQSAGTISRMHTTGNSLRMFVQIPQGNAVYNGLPGLHLTPGQWQVAFDYKTGSWSAVQGATRSLVASISTPSSIRQDVPATVYVHLKNPGNIDQRVTGTLKRGSVTIWSGTRWVNGQSSITIPVTFTPHLSGAHHVVFSNDTQRLASTAVDIKAGARPGPITLVGLTASPIALVAISFGVGMLIVVGVYGMWRRQTARL